jgi:hypothetical protein
VRTASGIFPDEASTRCSASTSLFRRGLRRRRRERPERGGGLDGRALHI